MAKSVYIDVHNLLSFEFDGVDHFNLRLGNLTDAGWYWSGDEKDLVGFFIRAFTGFEYSEKFIKEIEKEMPYETLKPFLLKAAKKGDGLYEISGDNQAWHFGTSFDGAEKDDLEEILELYNFTPEQQDKFKDYFYDNLTFDFDEFKKDYKEKYIDEITEIIEQSKSYKDLQKQLLDYQEKILTEDLQDFIEDRIIDAEGRAIAQLEKEYKTTFTKKINK